MANLLARDCSNRIAVLCSTSRSCVLLSVSELLSYDQKLFDLWFEKVVEVDLSTTGTIYHFSASIPSCRPLHARLEGSHSSRPAPANKAARARSPGSRGVGVRKLDDAASGNGSVAGDDGRSGEANAAEGEKGDKQLPDSEGGEESTAETDGRHNEFGKRTRARRGGHAAGGSRKRVKLEPAVNNSPANERALPSTPEPGPPPNAGDKLNAGSALQSEGGHMGPTLSAGAGAGAGEGGGGPAAPTVGSSALPTPVLDAELGDSAPPTPRSTADEAKDAPEAEGAGDFAQRGGAMSAPLPRGSARVRPTRVAAEKAIEKTAGILLNTTPKGEHSLAEDVADGEGAGNGSEAGKSTPAPRERKAGAAASHNPLYPELSSDAARAALKREKQARIELLKQQEKAADDLLDLLRDGMCLPLEFSTRVHVEERVRLLLCLCKAERILIDVSLSAPLQQQQGRGNARKYSVKEIQAVYGELVRGHADGFVDQRVEQNKVWPRFKHFVSLAHVWVRQVTCQLTSTDVVHFSELKLLKRTLDRCFPLITTSAVNSLNKRIAAVEKWIPKEKKELAAKPQLSALTTFFVARYRDCKHTYSAEALKLRDAVTLITPM